MSFPEQTALELLGGASAGGLEQSIPEPRAREKYAAAAPEEMSDNYPQWSPEELALRERLEAGYAVVIRKPGRSGPGPYKRLYEWAKAEGRYQNISRPPRGFTPPIPEPGTAASWGNPHKVGESLSRDAACDLFEEYLQQQPQLLERLPELRGKALGCSCAPLRCHGDHLAALANRGAESASNASRAAGQGVALPEGPAAAEGLSEAQDSRGDKGDKRDSVSELSPRGMPQLKYLGGVPKDRHRCHPCHPAESSLRPSPLPSHAYPTDYPAAAPETRLATRLVKTTTQARQAFPSDLDPQALEEWLEPRAGETYEQWQQRFDRADHLTRQQGRRR